MVGSLLSWVIFGLGSLLSWVVFGFLFAKKPSSLKALDGSMILISR